MYVNSGDNSLKTSVFPPSPCCSLFLFLHVTNDKVQYLCPYIDLCTVSSCWDWDSRTHTLSCSFLKHSGALRDVTYTVYSMIAWPHLSKHRCYGINVLPLILDVTFTGCFFPQLILILCNARSLDTTWSTRSCVPTGKYHYKCGLFRIKPTMSTIFDCNV